MENGVLKMIMMYYIHYILLEEEKVEIYECLYDCGNLEGDELRDYLELRPSLKVSYLFYVCISQYVASLSQGFQGARPPSFGDAMDKQRILTLVCFVSSED